MKQHALTLYERIGLGRKASLAFGSNIPVGVRGGQDMSLQLSAGKARAVPKAASSEMFDSRLAQTTVVE